MLDAARTFEFVRSPPGSRLEAPRGDRAGPWSFRINDQWRLRFVLTGAGPADVEVVDCHWRRMAMNGPVNCMRAVHPGEVLREEYLASLCLSVNALATAPGVPATRIDGIV